MSGQVFGSFYNSAYYRLSLLFPLFVRFIYIKRIPILHYKNIWQTLPSFSCVMLWTSAVLETCSSVKSADVLYIENYCRSNDSTITLLVSCTAYQGTKRRARMHEFCALGLKKHAQRVTVRYLWGPTTKSAPNVLKCVWLRSYYGTSIVYSRIRQGQIFWNTSILWRTSLQ